MTTQQERDYDLARNCVHAILEMARSYENDPKQFAARSAVYQLLGKVQGAVSPAQVSEILQKQLEKWRSAERTALDISNGQYREHGPRMLYNNVIVRLEGRAERERSGDTFRSRSGGMASGSSRYSGVAGGSGEYSSGLKDAWDAWHQAKEEDVEGATSALYGQVLRYVQSGIEALQKVQTSLEQ